MRAKLFFLCVLFSLGSLAFPGVYKTDAEASYYADEFHGRKTASGETFNMHAMTCAHRTLPFGTVLRVTNLSNNKSVEVRVNDRGPFVRGREIDLSKAAAQRLGMVKAGTARVRIEIVGKKEAAARPAETAAVPGAGAAGGACWDVQVGSFSNRENANKVAQDLLKKGFGNVCFRKTGSVTRVVLRNVPESSLGATESRLRQSGYSDFVAKRNGLR